MADYRKIIKFGSNSNIISLPKGWTAKHGLTPGNSVRLEEQGGNLLVIPGTNQSKAEKNDYLFSIDNDDIHIIKRKIINAYLNDCDTITLNGLSIPDKNKSIRNIIHQLMAFEIIEESAQRIQAKCYLNMEDISLKTLLRKIDAIIKTMMQDLITRIKQPGKLGKMDIAKNLAERDLDVNRLCFLIMRTVKHRLNNPGSNTNRTNAELIDIWDLAQTLEKVADIVKRLSQLVPNLNKQQANSFIELFTTIVKHYDDILTAYYKKDTEKTHILGTKRKDFLRSIDAYQGTNENTTLMARIVEKAKALFFRIDEITTIFDETKAI